ncbi:MAG: ATP synthase F1 subunit gamma [Bacteroidota bacterium]
MANLKEVRERIKSVKNTQQITKAMKMVSASKLRRAQMAITQMRPYADKLNAMLKNILSNLEGDANTSFGDERAVENACVVVVTSNKGLCGAFNTNVIKAAVATINEKFSAQLAAGKLTILPIGKKGYAYFAKRYKNSTIIEDYITLFDDLSFDNVAQVSQQLMDAFEGKTYDSIYVAYGRFRNAAVQYPECVQFLPVEKLEATSGSQSKHKADYIFEPNKEDLLKHLIPSILQTQFQKYLLDTHASEHGARMTAMDAATENAEELVKELKISYNKARQEAITKELSEIVGGAAALEG